MNIMWVGCPVGCLKTNNQDQNANMGLRVCLLSECGGFEKCRNGQ